MSLGDIVDDPITGRPFSAPERYRMMIEAAEVGDTLGLHGIYIGEHHGIDYTFSAPPILMSAIAARTTKLRVGSSVALAANLDPLRMAEDYATVDVISGGRVDLVVGRGNFFVDTYALFGQSIDDSYALFSESIELACELWPGKPVHWAGKFRAPLKGQKLQPTPVQQDTPIWVGGGSSPETAKLAGRLGLNLMLPSAFGKPGKFAPMADVYREAFAEAGHKHKAQVGACWHGWVGATAAKARARYEPRYRAYHAFNTAIIKSVNPDPPPYLTATFDYDFLTTDGPAIVGGPAEFAERLSKVATTVGADVNLIKMDMGGVPREEFVDMVRLLGEEVIPKLPSSAPAVARVSA
ncbi:Alkanal monooxygenase alpha chain [Terricaulis silvestris]|uniref:Alkanal monooxygenase alpha chain n=2 Tax=Terricaulis silvestris TaxID=2686094 RepID=A0A6I6MLB0_9CAUL|nr:Alkanal monooxygenase alpha chain [Terricaulis silvestris]